MTNKIHKTAVIDKRVQLGQGNEIGPYSVITGPTFLGDDNIIGSHVVIGSPGQDTRNPRYYSAESKIYIGSRNIIREFTAIQKPCYTDETRLESDIYLMQGVHIPHDAYIDHGVVITPSVILAGLVKVLRGANLGLGCTVHQRAIIGQFSIVAMGAALVKNLRPFCKFVPGRPITVNTYAIHKFGFSELELEISNYVLERVPPTTPQLVAEVSKFERFLNGSNLHTL
jgi:UDP-N-acetylglucosamine acyltransferase